MERQITSKFEVPAASFPSISVFVITTWVVLYDRIIIPLASKARGKIVCLNLKQRMGINILLSTFYYRLSPWQHWRSLRVVGGKLQQERIFKRSWSLIEHFSNMVITAFYPEWISWGFQCYRTEWVLLRWAAKNLGQCSLYAATVRIIRRKPGIRFYS